MRPKDYKSTVKTVNITTTLRTLNLWSLLTGGRRSEVALCYKKWNWDPKIVDVIRRWSLPQVGLYFHFKLCKRIFFFVPDCPWTCRVISRASPAQVHQPQVHVRFGGRVGPHPQSGHSGSFILRREPTATRTLQCSRLLASLHHSSGMWRHMNLFCDVTWIHSALKFSLRISYISCSFSILWSFSIFPLATGDLALKAPLEKLNTLV